MVKEIDKYKPLKDEVARLWNMRLLEHWERYQIDLRSS